MGFGGTFQFAPVKSIGRIECDADALLGEQEIGDFPPCLAPLAQLVDEIKVRFQGALEWFAAAFWLSRIGHHGQNNSTAKNLCQE